MSIRDWDWMDNKKDMDRIEINGIWYVKEDSSSHSVQNDIKVDLEATSFLGRVYESDDYCFEASKILDDGGKPYSDVAIELTIKEGNREDWKKDYLDNENWFFGVLDNNPESMQYAKEMFTKQGLAEFRYVIEDLIEIGWLTRK